MRQPPRRTSDCVAAKIPTVPSSALGAVALLASLVAAASAHGAGPDKTALRPVAGILDYVGSDYAEAVNEAGQIVNQGEYDEQFELVRQARAIALEAGLAEDDAVLRGLAELRALLEEIPPPAVVLAKSRAIKAELVESHGLVLEPAAVASRERARTLWISTGCATCHGPDGGADTAFTETLDPPPANFLDPDRIAGVSPHRAFHAITFGVEGTGMVGYDTLPAADRWALAFHSLALRHDDADLEAGRRAFESADVALAPTGRRLSQLSEDDLREILEPVPAGSRDEALAWLRVEAPFASRPDAPLALALDLLDRGVAAYADGRPEDARIAFVSAYLDGIEPLEAGLAARNPELVRKVEAEMLAIRALVDDGAPPSEVESRATAIAGMLDRAGEGRLDATATLLAALAIALREGLEAALLLAALFAILRRRGAEHHVRAVHGGWIAALLAGVGTWLVAGKALGGMERELAEGVVALAAAVVLLFATHWTLGQATSKHWVGFIGRRLAAAVDGRWGAWAVGGLAFIAVYREVFEVVLFYQALLIDPDASTAAVWLGTLAGLAILLVVIFVVRRVGRRLEPRGLLLGSSVLLALLAVMLVGKGVHALQEAAVVSITPTATPAVPALGLHASVETLAAQAVLVALLLGSAVRTWLGASRGAEDESDVVGGGTAAPARG